VQYYFETIFPRIPKTVTDEIVGDLKSMGLPSAAKGNAGQGGRVVQSICRVGVP